jgi:pimeloyl-ACP methyl ester carboxylesterase
MAIARNGDAHLHWREEGEGEPLVLVMGLGGSSLAWHRLLPHLRGRARLVLLDNRGTGQSDRIRGRFTLADMVADTLAVMDAAELEDAHVLGVSMGGMIAQHLALEHRSRVRSLVLGCTTPASRSSAPPWRLIAAAGVRSLAPEASFDLLVPALYAERTRREHPERIREDFALRAREATPPATVVAQMLAVGGHDTRRRLAELAGLPVTVVHGAEDALIPPARGRDLAARIPGAAHVEIPGAGHMMTTDAEAETVAAVLHHLERAAAAPRPCGPRHHEVARATLRSFPKSSAQAEREGPSD